MSRNNVNFESTLEKTVRIMSRQFGVDLKIEGNRACTDGKTIYLPMMEDVEDELPILIPLLPYLNLPCF